MRLLALLCLVASMVTVRSARAAEYYVATTGSDSNPGTLAQPFATLQRGHTAAAAGDTVYIRGGTYNIVGQGASSAAGIAISKSGTSDARRIRFWAYEGEVPIFDFSRLTISTTGYTVGFSVTGSWLHFKGLEIRNVPMNTRSNTGMSVGDCSNNIFELMNFHHNNGSGFFISHGTGGHLVLNCDSHDNYDPTSSQGAGQNADGFGIHYQETGANTIVRGCRAWWNSDDGYDLISQEVPVIIESSWAMANGYFNSGTERPSSGNGNGFKAGSSKTGIRHVVRNCLAWKNPASGFYANHSSCGNDWFNNTAYMNGTQYNMLASTWDADGNRTDGVVLTGARVHRMRNNIGYPNKNSNMQGVDTMFNTWDLGITPGSGDFTSVSDTNVVMGARKADGSLPDVPFMHLSANSAMINKGTDVGLPFVGSAPDLGAYEYGAVTSGGGGAGGAGSGGAGAGGAGTSGAGGGSGVGAGGRGGAAGGGAGRGGSGGVAGTGGRGGAGGSAAGAGGASGASGLAGVGGGASGAGGSAGASGAGGATTGVAGTTATGGGTAGGGAAGVTGGGGTTAPPDDPAVGGCACAIDATAGDASLASLLCLLALGLTFARRRRAL